MKNYVFLLSLIVSITLTISAMQLDLESSQERLIEAIRHNSLVEVRTALAAGAVVTPAVQLVAGAQEGLDAGIQFALASN